MPPRNQIVVNPQELLKFATDLRAFNAQTEVSTKRLKAQFKKLGVTWQDQQFKQFAAEFNSTMLAIERLDTLFQTKEPLLRRKAKLLITAENARV